MLAAGLRVRARVVGRFDEVRRGLQEDQRRHRGRELGLAFAGSLTVRVSVRPRPLVDGVREALRIACLGLGRGDVPLYGVHAPTIFFDVLAGELKHESPVGLDAFYQPRRRVVHGVLPRHVGVWAAASVSKYHLIASL